MRNDPDYEASRYRVVKHAAWTVVIMSIMVASGFRLQWPAARWTWDNTAVRLYHAVQDDKTPAVQADPVPVDTTPVVGP